MTTTRAFPRPFGTENRRRLLVGMALLAGVCVRGGVRLEAGEDDARQVTLCGIIATPGDTTVDKRLAAIEPQLRKLMPGAGFKLLDVRTKRLKAGQSVTCRLGGVGSAAEALLIDPLDSNGKVGIKCDVLLNGIPQPSTTVNTPPNQLFFRDQELPDGTHLLIGIGAR
jgi:hypothetical protein